MLKYEQLSPEITEKINKTLIRFNIEKYKDIKIKDLDLYEKYLICFTGKLTS